jgi:flagellar biogenesis protein FliO
VPKRHVSTFILILLLIQFASVSLYAIESGSASISASQKPVRTYPIPSPRDGTSRSVNNSDRRFFGSISTSIVLVLAGVGGTYWAIRRHRNAGFFPSQSSEGVAIRVVSRVSLGPRQAAILIRVGAKQVLVGVGPQGTPSLLAAWPVDAPTAEGLEA